MKKQIKRMVSLALALVLCLSLGATAWAEEDVETYGGPGPTGLIGDAWAQELLDSDEVRDVSRYLWSQMELDWDSEIDCTQPITRSEFAGVALALWEYRNNYPDIWRWEGDSPSPFDDTNDDYVRQAHSYGLVNGVSETLFDPDGLLNREQAATMLARAIKDETAELPSGNTAFADDAQIGSWAKGAVILMAEKGVVGGVGDNRFAPQQTLSIQEALVMAVRAMALGQVQYGY